MSYLNLKNFWLSIRRDRYILFALFVGLVLRGLNSTFGSPSLYVSNDEAIAHLSALNMIASKTPVSIANYTPLGAYVQIPFLVLSFLVMRLLDLVQSVRDFQLFLLTHEGYFLFIPRLISAFFGTLTILVIYKLTFLLFKDKKTAIIAAFLTATSFNLVHISHFGRPWPGALFFFVLAVYLVLKDKKILSPVSVALSYGFHQVGILAFPLIFYKLIKRNLLGVIPSLTVFVVMIGSFSLLTLRKGLIESIDNNQSFLLKGKFLADLLTGGNNLWVSFIRTLNENLSLYFLANLFSTDGIILLFGLLGIFLYLVKKRSHLEIILYIILYYVFASLFFHPLIRYLLPILLLLIPYSAWAIQSIFLKKPFIIIAILLIASVNSIWWNYIFLQKPTFILTHNWINYYVSSETPIYFIGGRFMTFAPNKESILNIQSQYPNYKKSLLRVLLNKGNENTRNIIYVSHFSGGNKLEQLKNASKGVSDGYVIDYYLDPVESIIFRHPDEFEVVKRFAPTRDRKVAVISEPLFDASWNFFTSDFKSKISMYGLVNTGPFVDILQIKDLQQR